MNQKISAMPAGRQMLNWRASVSRLLGVATLAGSVLLFAGSLRANTELDVATGLPANSDLSTGASYTGGTAPTATSDVTFKAGNAYTSPYNFGSAVTIGSFNDLSATALTISGGGGTQTLAGGDSVSGNTGDLFYVASGANLTYSQNLMLGMTGNFNVMGTATITSVITDGGNQNANAPSAISFGIVKTGTGNLTLTNNSPFTGGVTINGGTLTENFGGQGYAGIRGTVTVNTGGTLVLNAGDALGYNTTGNSVQQLTINGGTVNIAVNGNEGFTTNLTMTGGTFSSTGGGAFNINPTATNAPTINSLASATTALISANIVNRQGGTPVIFTVAAGAAGTNIGSDLTVSGVISGGGITKNGAGILLLTGANTYTGATTVNAGRLLVTSGTTTSYTGGVGVTGTGTIFGGSGTVAGNINIGNGATLTTRNRTATTLTAGALTTGPLTLQTGSIFDALLTSNTSFSTLNANGTTDLSNASFKISLTTGATFTNGQVLELITSSVANAFTNTTYTAGGYTFTADYSRGDFAVDVAPAAVPEPSTWAGLVAMAGLLGFAHRRWVRPQVG